MKWRPHSDDMSAKVKQLAWIVLGWILVLLGIPGVVLPILPGVPLMIAGLLILGRYYAWPRRFLTLLRTKAQRLGTRYRDHS